MEIDNTELEALIERLRADIGSEWLDAQKARPKGASLPLVEWLGELDQSPKGEWSKHEVSLRLANLSRAIDDLRTADIEGVENRVAELRTEDPAKFYSVSQELRTAAEYSSLGCKVQFIPVSTAPRPDLLLDDEIEIECKYKIGDSPVDIERYRLYELLRQQSQKAITQSSKNVDLSVETVFREEPQRADVNELVSVVRRATTDSRFISETRTHGKFTYRVAAERHTNKAPSVSQAWAERFHYIISSGSMAATKDGLVTKDVLLLGAKCNVVQDRLRGLQKSFEKARKQFSGTRPAVIQVDVTSALPAFEHAEDGYRRKIVDDFLRNNTTVSAIILAHDHVQLDTKMIGTTRHLEIFSNNGARMPMPASLSARLQQG